MGAAHNYLGSSSDAVATAVFADINIAVAALQDVLVMACVAHLASEAPPRRAMKDALKASRMLAFMIVLQLGEDPVNTNTPLTRKYVRTSVSFHNLLGTLFDAIRICSNAFAFLPAHTTHVAELSFAWTSATNEHRLLLKDDRNLRDVITTASQLDHTGASITGLPSHLVCQLPSLPKRRIVRAVRCPMEGLVAKRAGFCAALWTYCAVRPRFNTVWDNKGGTIVVTAVCLLVRSIFHSR
jgi:hypothetical protein